MFCFTAEILFLKQDLSLADPASPGQSFFPISPVLEDRWAFASVPGFFMDAGVPNAVYLYSERFVN